MQLKDLTVHDQSVVVMACKAMAEGKRMQILYHPQGKPHEDRIVEVHAVGLSQKGLPCMRVWQVQGGSVFGENTGWKMLSMHDTDNAIILDDNSLGPRPGYTPGDKGMSTILSEISNEPVPKEAG